MARLGTYEVHPAADAYPLIADDDFAKLVDSIKRNGLREPIVLNHDRTVLVDGRNRYRACEEAGVDPVFTTLGAHYTELMILELIVDRNERRRDMNPGQKAMVAEALEPMFAEATAKGRPRDDGSEAARSRRVTEKRRDPASFPSRRVTKDSGKAAAKAAKTVGASRDGVARAKALRRDAPDLAAQVKAGTLALDAAYKQMRQRKKTEPKPEQDKPTSVTLTLRTHDGTAVEYPKPKAKAQFNRTTGDGISWAGWSWNPVTGCLHGCDYCYARELATRDSYRAAYPVGFTPLFHHERLDAPANTPFPDGAHGTDRGRVFVCSMADLYGRWVPQEWIDEVHTAELANPQWEYLHLTKFPDRYVGLDLPKSGWIGTSVDEQKRVRIAERAFAQIDDVAVKWLSLEPLREPLQFTDLSMFDWVVIGAQTETRQPSGLVEAFAPPFDWVNRIYNQAREAGCKIHLKPNLFNGKPGSQPTDEYPEPER